MQGEGAIGCPAPVQQTLLYHRLGSAGPFLAWLKHELDPSGKSIAPAVQQSCRRRQHRGMGVMAAGVHATLQLGSEVEARIFLDGKGIHVASQHDRRAGLRAFQGRDDAAGGFAECQVQIQVFDGGQDRRLGFGQVIAELRMPVNAPPQLNGPGQQRFGVIQELGFDIGHGGNSKVGWRVRLT